MTGTSPINVGCLHVAQAAGLRAGQQEHIGLGWGGSEWEGGNSIAGGCGGQEQGVGRGQEEDKQEGSPPPATGNSGLGCP